MLSYQHAYHAGGPADIHKHVALSAVLDRLVAKDKSFVILDLYAGHGLYDLASPEAVKTGEAATGIGRLWPLQGEIPAAVQNFFARIRSLNPPNAIIHYPGSPALVRTVLRADDRLILNEKHPVALADLHRWAGHDTRIAIHERDGLEALVGLTPPLIRRGLALIDPSYEVKSEYAAVPTALAAAVRKWPQGIYLVWYPVLADGRHHELIDGIEAQIPSEIYQCELTLRASNHMSAPGLQGTGMIAVNPPWQFDTQMEVAGDWLAHTMTDGGTHHSRWVKRATPSPP